MASSGARSDAEISNAASARGFEYEVFLSFRGPDTRYKFADHLYNGLVHSGIRTYRDNEELPVGEVIGQELLNAIKQSKIAIPILSKGYAESKWCLNELVQIMECKRHGSLKVMPIFYDVSPSKVRKQTGSYKEAFKLHEKRHDDKTIEDWKRALREVGESKGWDLQSDGNREEGKLVKEVIGEVWLELINKVHLIANEDLVGVDDHADEILRKMNAERDGLVLGIYGMGGIGKTTLAKYIYHRLFHQFERCSLVADIRENLKTKGILFLLKKLIADILSKELAENIDVDRGFAIISERLYTKKVLILLDDLDSDSKIVKLIQRRDCFASGSKIIITTRNKHILTAVDADWRYELHVMHDQHARELFIKCAFLNEQSSKSYEELIEKAVEISGRLPLCLEVIGSLLRNEDKELWQSTLEKLKDVPHEDVKKRLAISFETIDEQQRQVLADIAWFFVGVDHRMAIHFWDGKLHPRQAIKDLQRRSLIKIDADHKIEMHDLMREVCKEDINEGRSSEPKRQCIARDLKEAEEIFEEETVAESIQGLFLEFSMQSKSLYTAENFAKLPNLRFLQVEGEDISQVISLFQRGLRTIASLFSQLQRSPLTLSELRWLCWRHFPPIYELNNISSKNLVFLDLSESSISDGWDRRSPIKIAKRLKVLNLSGCKKLTKTPNLSENCLLEQLIMERCSSLIEIDSSITTLENLLIINLRGCTSLCKLPTEFCGMKSLVELILDDTSVSKFPMSIGDSKHLSLLSLRNCSKIQALPKSITGLESVVQLDLSFSKIVELPDSIGEMKNLKILNVDGCPISELPTSIEMLERLEVISADKCCRLESIPELPHSLTSLTVHSEASRMKRIPDFSNLTSLEHLIVFFRDVPCHPSETAIIWNIGKLCKLVDLKVGFRHIQILHGDLSRLSLLKELVLEKCHRLRSIQELPSSLTVLQVKYCWLLDSLPDLSHLKMLRSLHIGHTPILKLEGLQMLENLRELVLDDCGIQRLPDMSKLNKLRVLKVKSCPDLIEIEGISLESLKELCLCNCISLEKMPDILNKEIIRSFSIVQCGKYSSDDDEDPTKIELKKAADDFMKIFQEEDPREIKREKAADDFIISPFIIPPFILLLSLVLVLLARNFLGFDPHRLSWLGALLPLILIFLEDNCEKIALTMDATMEHLNEMEDADKPRPPIGIIILLVLILVVPKLLGLEPYRLFWYLCGVFLKICS